VLLTEGADLGKLGVGVVPLGVEVGEHDAVDVVLGEFAALGDEPVFDEQQEHRDGVAAQAHVEGDNTVCARHVAASTCSTP
jgi:hypothetical protein